MFHVVLFEPEIPPNTGNVIRLCANAGAQLHLVEPLGFPIDHKQMRRAGLDYHEFAHMQVHGNLGEALTYIEKVNGEAPRVFGLSTKGRQRPDGISFQKGDVFLFGPETRGLPPDVLEALPETQRLRLPMMPDNRSLNLSNTVAILVYEAWRQQGYAGGI